MLEIKGIEHGQIFYATGDDGKPYSLKAWGSPVLVDGIWQIEAEDCGNYSYTFTEEDEGILFLTDGLEET